MNGLKERDLDMIAKQNKDAAQSEFKFRGQSKKHSLIEIISSTVFGYFIALITQMILFPMFDIHTSHSDNMLIALIFTIISIIRGYIFRRIFNSLCK